MTTNKTMTLKDYNRHVRPPYADFEPSIPAFMEARGVCAVLVRPKGRLYFDERWVKTGGFVTEAIPASEFQTQMYANYGEEVFDELADVPEPIAVHDEDVWMECTQGEYDDFVQDYQSLAYAA